MPGVSDEQIQRAKDISLLDYLRAYEPQSIRRCGANEYCLKEHDSFKITTGKWRWFSRGIGGRGALDYLIRVCGYDFKEAVNHLTDGGARVHLNTHPPPKTVETKAATAKPFSLPPANVNNDRAIAYLRGRGIDRDILKRCVENGTLYENKAHNCVFVGFDGQTPKFACERGTTDGYKKDVFGSNKAFSFCLPPETAVSTVLACFEAPVDVLSHATICKMGGHGWDGHRLSLGGVGSAALTGFLERHPEITSVQLSLDSDKAGQDATKRIIKELLSDSRFSHLKISVALAPLGTDFNDTLQAIHQLNRDKSKPDRQQAVNLL
jgi:hypothetical protein